MAYYYVLSSIKYLHMKSILPAIASKKIITLALFSIVLNSSYAQHSAHASIKTPVIQPFSTFLSDPELAKFKFETIIFELGPGQSDTISHRHDCDLFVIVLEGTLQIGQEFKDPFTVRTGEIFHEKRNVIHSVSINPDQHNPMKALVVFIRKDGRSGYTPLYPKK